MPDRCSWEYCATPPHLDSMPEHISMLPADAAKAVREVLRTVAQCHSRHVVLRDVKPENFLYLTHHEDAPLKAIDFGIADYCQPGQTLNDKAGRWHSCCKQQYIACSWGCSFVHAIFVALSCSMTVPIMQQSLHAAFAYALRLPPCTAPTVWRFCCSAKKCVPSGVFDP